MTEDLRCNEHKCQARDCSHVKCLMKQVTVNGMAVTMPIVFHHKLEHNGWHHKANTRLAPLHKVKQ